MSNIKLIQTTLLLSISIIAVIIFYLYLIAGGIPTLEYAYNTRYSKGYNNLQFQQISIGLNIRDVLSENGAPLIIKEYSDPEITISVYYYSYLKEGRYWGKVGNINARILVVSDEIIINKISEVLPRYKLKPKYIANNFVILPKDS